jgi:GlpG protein
MRKISSFDSDSDLIDAKSFLYFYGIKTAQRSDDDLTLWVICDDDLSEARRRIADIKSSGSEEKISQGKQQIIKDQQLELLQQKRSFEINVRDGYLNSYSSFPLTIAILVICCLLFFLSLSNNRILFSYFSFSNYISPPMYEISKGEIWRLVTPIFLHQGFFHVLFNMYWLFRLGSLIEKNYTKAYLLLILFTAILSNLCFYFVSGPAFLGFSGVNYGFIGFLWALSELDPFAKIRIDFGTFQFFFVWFGICLVLSLVGFPIANTIHGVGALSGIVFAIIILTFQEKSFRYVNKLFSKDRLNNLLIILGGILLGVIVDFVK